MNTRGLLILLSVSCFPVSMADGTEHVSVVEGHSFTLRSNLSEILNQDTILWLFGPNPTLVVHMERKDDFTSFFKSEDELFRSRLQVDQKTGSITITNSRSALSGMYKLSITKKETVSKIFNVAITTVDQEDDGLKSKSISVTAGEHINLNPDAEIAQDALLLWRFGDKGVLLAKVYMELNKAVVSDRDERFRGRLKLDHQTRSLTITHSRTTDSGLYELQIGGSESLQRFFVSVTDAQISSGAITGITFSVLIPCVLLTAAFIYAYIRIRRLKMQRGEALSAMEGTAVTLCTDLTRLQSYEAVEWFYEGNAIAEVKEGMKKAHEAVDWRFLSKLSLNDIGDLTISNTRKIHSGLYKLRIISAGRNICSNRTRTKPIEKRFTVTINERQVPVKIGEDVPLRTGVQIVPGHEILWTFGPTNCLIVKADSERVHFLNERFQGRLVLDLQTGSLTVRRITDDDLGYFKLQIMNNEKTRFRRFNVILENQVRNSVNSPLMDDQNGINLVRVSSFSTS